MSKLPETRLSLIANLGDAANAVAWGEFLQVYESAILRYCQSRGLGLEDASEVVQDVCMAVHRSAATWNPSGRSGGFRSWLFETARRLCLTALRNRSRDQAFVCSSIDQEFESNWTCDDNQDIDWERWAFYWACGQVQSVVKPQTWRAFWLTAIEDKAPELVASELSMNVGAVYAAKCRTLARIRSIVTELSRGEYRDDR
jgi:RNA polymerase sigma factor (sigma-70 family)